MGSASSGGVDPDDYVVDDANEVRVAGEDPFTNLPSPLSAIAVRGGYWFDPDDPIRYEGPFSTDTVVYPAGEGRGALHVRRRHRIREGAVRRRLRLFRDGEDVLAIGGASLLELEGSRSDDGSKAGRQSPGLRGFWGPSESPRDQARPPSSTAGDQLQDARRDEFLIRRQRACAGLCERIVLAGGVDQRRPLFPAALEAPGRRGCWRGTGKRVATSGSGLTACSRMSAACLYWPERNSFTPVRSALASLVVLLRTFDEGELMPARQLCRCATCPCYSSRSAATSRRRRGGRPCAGSPGARGPRPAARRHSAPSRSRAGVFPLPRAAPRRRRPP